MHIHRIVIAIEIMAHFLGSISFGMYPKPIVIMHTSFHQKKEPGINLPNEESIKEEILARKRKIHAAEKLKNLPEPKDMLKAKLRKEIYERLADEEYRKAKARHEAEKAKRFAQAMEREILLQQKSRNEAQKMQSEAPA